MKVSGGVISRYLRTVTEGFAIARYLRSKQTGVRESDADPIEELEVFTDDIEQMLADARANDDEDLLRLVLEDLLAGPTVELLDFQGQVYAFTDQDLYQLFDFTFSQAWPDEVRKGPGEPPHFELVAMSDEEWAIRRGRT